MPGLPNGLFPSGFSTKTQYMLLPHLCYMPRPSHSSRFYHLYNMGWGVKIMKLLIMTLLLRLVFLFNCVCTLCTVPITILTVLSVKWCLPQTVWTGPTTLLKEYLCCLVRQERVWSYLTTVWHFGLFGFCPWFCFAT
jgi:hypothetical protein